VTEDERRGRDTFAAVTRLECAACGASPPAAEPYPFRCPSAEPGDDRDHVLVRRLTGAPCRFADPDATQPFIRYREGSHAWTRARAGGIPDAEFVAMVERLDSEIARVDGRGFVMTPFERHAALARRLGMDAGVVWVKDETRHVAGSHKARHLFGIALHLEVSERLGLTSRAETDRRGLAIASCGNAALAAAVIARAGGRPLDVFIPADADAGVVARLETLGARIAVCARKPGVAGDPCVRAFHRAIAAGRLAFCVQGNENGLAVEGAHALAHEMAETLARDQTPLDRVFVQVGGGALASACAAGFHDALVRGLLPRAPKLHPVQTASAFPLRRAYERVRLDALARLGAHAAGGDDAALADRLAAPGAHAALRAAMAHARAHRSVYMWPVESAPHSVAHGILDDETYDWAAIIEAVLESGGWPVTVDEATLIEARELAQGSTTIRADATGTAGLAGLLALRRGGWVGAWESTAVVFTGIHRGE